MPSSSVTHAFAPFADRIDAASRPDRRRDLLQKDLRHTIPIEAPDILTAKRAVAGALAWPGRGSNSIRACASAATSLCGTSRLARRPGTTSGIAAARVATTGRPPAIASRNTIPKPSCTLGRQKISRCRSARSSSASAAGEDHRVVQPQLGRQRAQVGVLRPIGGDVEANQQVVAQRAQQRRQVVGVWYDCAVLVQ